MPILLMLVQTLLPQILTALEPAIANLLKAHSSGDAAAISNAVASVASISADAFALNALIGACKARGTDPTPDELAPFTLHLVAAISKFETDLNAAPPIPVVPTP